MPRLFVAIDLPDAVTAELARIRPAALDGIRRVEPGQMHLTLNFLGEQDLERTIAALKPVAAGAFALTLGGVGMFPGKDRATTLWAGVQENESLRQLHRAVAEALAEIGFQPEARPYAPHITLARCEPNVATAEIADYLGRNTVFVVRDMAIETFALFSSRFVEGVPEYQCEARQNFARR